MSRPNLLVVMVDQMRLQAMGFWNTPGFELPYKSDPVHTPNLNRFAQESLVLSSAVSNNPVCSPYRAMFMTGQYPPNNGCPSNCNSNTAPFDCELPQDAVCWSDVLKEQGYSLGYIGKWHLDAPYEPYVDCSNNRGKCAWNEWCPPERRHGFDFWYSYGTYDQHMNPLYWDNDAGRHEFNYVGQWGPEHETDLAIKYLQNAGGEYREADEPFALVVSMNPPHTPFDQFPKRYLDHYEGMDSDDLLNRSNVQTDSEAHRHIKGYLAMVTGIDEQFGRVLDCLDAQGLRDDTIVLFTSDHGCCLGSNEHMHKNIHYEEALMIPFLIRWPGAIPERHDRDLLFSVPDTYPTLLGLLGLASAVPKQVEGTDFSDYLVGESNARPSSALYYHYDPGNTFGARGVRTDRHTLVVGLSPEEHQIILHDNQNDPYQMKNVAEDQPETVERLLGEELLPWLTKTSDPWLETAQAAGLSFS